ncbi:cytochrome b5-like protein [Leishmania mexicana MHOM/GT/2001/U1103]|uniref:Cytochrome b5-like protein n=1 Tax=Leishmania mexicana (strain MHOM/GT/2001/U1103) TaxID=929439 RepID=E9AL98_LEIMU|nr:cytochrome b5-like protein [Leishmania mexicana MHOM/GT/2001/U1103]CBZ23701.1 cytochrome b5-like protein [Leishmania mexicana MHOM/GT/2001/U1103]
MHNRVVHVPWHMPLDPSGKRIITDDASGDSVKRFYVVLGLEETEAYASSRSVAYCPTGGGGGDLIGILHTHTHTKSIMLRPCPLGACFESLSSEAPPPAHATPSSSRCSDRHTDSHGSSPLPLQLFSNSNSCFSCLLCR